ncbi:MAG: lysozyme [Sulfitobacter sp.]|nr:lysozyme [Sulfitobacter sp.]
MAGWTSRRWVRAAAAIVIVAGLVGGGGYWFVRFHRPGLGPGELYGIDVSHHQGRIDWESVAGDEIAFAYIKATEGGDWIDPRFDENWHGARAAGLEVGAYHFFTNCEPGLVQARNFLGAVPLGEVSLPLALDLEFVGQCPGVPEPVALRNEIAEFIVEVERVAGGPVVLYVLDDFEDRYSVLENFDGPRWWRNLYRRPSGDDWVIWQYSGTAAIDGIDGRVDLNVADLADLGG